VLQASLKDVDLVQEGRLILVQAAFGDERLEDLLGVRATVGSRPMRRDPALAFRIPT
jgi:hypothetical protein